MVTQAVSDFKKDSDNGFKLSPLQVAANDVNWHENKLGKIASGAMSFYLPGSGIVARYAKAGLASVGFIVDSYGNTKADGMYGILKTNGKGEKVVRPYLKTPGSP